ncbi:MAG: aldo/keto reductase [Eubacteriales bacterium]
MQYRKMPKGKDKLSALGFGCMRLPTRFGGAASAAIDKEEATKLVRDAIDQGVNYLDTAWPYHLGASESFLGDSVLTDGYREKVFLATKLPCFMIRKTESMQTIFDKQLQKLNTDYIDYYLAHSLEATSWTAMKALGIVAFMDKIKAEGKVRHMGFSFHGKKDDFMQIVDDYPWDFVQVQYNILDEHFQAGIEGIEYAAKKGMGVIVMEPMRGGTLVDRIPDEVKRIYDASGFNRSAADWAFRWIYNNPNVTVVLSGMNTKSQVDENVRVASEALANGMDDKELATIQSVKDTYHRLLTVGCTGCAYCMPCPAGIDIPGALKNLNNYHMFKKSSAKFDHLRFAGISTADGKPHWTDACIDCGKCEEKCPQGVPVRKTFLKVQKDLETTPIKVMAAIGRAVMGGGKK